MDLGGGWGSIGIAAASMNCSTIGVDIAGVVYQGTLHGQIRARVQIDFAEQRETNLLRRIAKKAGMTLSSIMAVWLSPECTLLSKANNMNKSRGCAHGLYAESEQNKAAATPQRLEEEREKYRRCVIAIEQQMRALEEEDVLFMLENPHGSQFWELESVTSRIDRLKSKGWRVFTVDQCAYGRKVQKTTKILTNVQWEPKGSTGTGRCVVGLCGGTQGNTPGAPGAGRHLQQTVTSESSRRTRMGDREKGAKAEYSVAAAKNRVETSLVQELIAAAQKQWEAGRGQKRKREQEK